MPGYKRTLEVYGDAKKVKLNRDVSKTVRLNPYSKEVLLEQTLRVVDSDNVMPRSSLSLIMFTSKHFFCIAKQRSVYRLSIKLTPAYTVFGFSDFASGYFYPFQFTYEKTMMLINFLEPCHVSMTIDLKNNERSAFLDLLTYSKGKLELEFTHDLDIAPSIIENKWSSLNALKCTASELPQTVSPKKFDTLYIFDIKSIEELQNALRHSVKALYLYFDEDFVNGDELPRIQNIGKIENCYVNGEGAVFPKAVQTIVSNCPRIRKLICNNRFACRSAQENTVQQIIDDIVENYNTYKDAIRRVTQSGINSTVNTNIFYSGKDFKLPRNWIERLLVDSDFLGTQNKTTISHDKVKTTFSNQQKTDKLNASFNVEVCYKYVQTIGERIAKEFEEIFGHFD